MNILALSTLAHIYAILPFILYGGIYDPLYSLYCFVIIMTAIMTMQWHTHSEPFGLLCFLVFFMHFLHITLEAYLTYDCCGTDTYILVLQLTSLVSLLNMIIGSPNTENYVLRHSAWHLVFAAKATFVSYIIATKMTV